MATILRTWSFRYPWLYDSISALTALLVGGEGRLRRLPLVGLRPEGTALDLCCGSGLSTQILQEMGWCVTGLDASKVSLGAAARRVPTARFVLGRAERLPFADGSFDLVHTSLALHELNIQTIRQIITEVRRVLKPGGVLVLLDFHRPTQPWFWPGLALFLGVFETSTAWALLDLDLQAELAGFKVSQRLYAGGSLQVIQACTTPTNVCG